MASKKIAICVDAEAFQANRILDPHWACKFPGAQVMPIFAEMAKKAGFEVVTGDIAVSHVHNGYWRAADIIVIQDMDCSIGLELVGLGAEPKILLAFESPIFAWPFYDRLPQLGRQFEHRVLFKGAFGLFPENNGHNHNAYFPSFSLGQLAEPVPWENRGLLVMVAANKHCRKPVRFPLSLNPGRYVKWIRKQSKKRQSAALRMAVKNELQTKRFEAIEYFGGQRKLAVFGFGWDRRKKMPKLWQKKLRKILPEIDPKPCDDKIETMSKYKFAVCFENTSYPGYVTEKIIDCFTASVIPVYLGAPDISDFVPPDTFIDMRKFGSWQQLDEYIENMSEKQAGEMIKAGRQFLRSPKGRRHSFENFAKFLFDLLV